MSRNEKYMPEPGEETTLRSDILDDAEKFDDVMCCNFFDNNETCDKHGKLFLEMFKSREKGDDEGILKAAKALCDLVEIALDEVSMSDSDYDDYLYDLRNPPDPYPGWGPSCSGYGSNSHEHVFRATHRGDGY